MRKKLHLRYWIAFGFLALLLMSFIVWNINSGSIEISVREIMEILFLGKGEDTALNIIWEIRLPRILAGQPLSWEALYLYPVSFYRLFSVIP